MEESQIQYNIFEIYRLILRRLTSWASSLACVRQKTNILPTLNMGPSLSSSCIMCLSLGHVRCINLSHSAHCFQVGVRPRLHRKSQWETEMHDAAWQVPWLFACFPFPFAYFSRHIAGFLDYFQLSYSHEFKRPVSGNNSFGSQNKHDASIQLPDDFGLLRYKTFG